MLVNADTYYTQITYRTRLRKLDIISACGRQIGRCSAEQYSSNTCKVKWMYTQRETERQREMDRHAGLVSSEVREVDGR